MAYVEKDSALAIRGGDILWILGKPRLIRDNPNPEAFNYAGFLRRRGITHEIYCRKGDWCRASQTALAGWQSFLFFSRQYCMDRLREALPDAVQYSIAAALVIGNRESLQAEVRDVFSKTGAMHVLAVSGLHVGMVAWCLTWILLKIPGKGQGWTLLRVLVQSAGVWAYVLICGAGPSVVRAGLMFSWYLAGKTLGRPGNIWNTWFGSAFLLLLYEPQWLFDIGFQLSYLAVGGIVLVEPLIFKVLAPSQRVVVYFWKLSSVGLAAQLATGPLSVYYFHQFPLGFLLSGWVAVPLGAVVQALGMAVGLFGEIPFVSDGLGALLGLSIAAMYGALEWIAALPGQCLEGLWLSLAGLCWAYALLASAVRLSLAFSKPWVWICLGLLLAGSVGRIVQGRRAAQRAEVLCYGIQGASALEFWQGREVLAWYKGSESRIRDQCENLHLKYGSPSFAPSTRPLSLGDLASVGTLISFRGLRFFIWDGRSRALPPPGADYWILRFNPYLPARGLDGRLPAKGVVIDGSNMPSRASFYLRWCKAQRIAVHYTLEQGAWRLQVPKQ
jgi:competence protein ComEC